MSAPSCPGTAVLSSQLQKWFNNWWNRPPGDEEKDVVYRLLQSEHSEWVDRLRPTEVREWVRTWNKRLSLSLSEEVPRERVLCAFTAVEDLIYRLDQEELDAFVAWAAGQLGITPQDLVDDAGTRATSQQNARGGNLLDACYDLIDVLAALLYAWQPGRAGLRPKMTETALRSQLEAYVQSRNLARPGTVFRLLGGAAGNMANVLRKLGAKVTVHWPYHAAELAGLCPDCLKYLSLADDRKEYFPAKNCGSEAHPKRLSIVFTYSPGLTLNPAPAQLANRGPEKQDRQIYKDPNFGTAGRRGWSKMLLDDGGGQRIEILDPGDAVLRGERWPFLPVFGDWQIEGGDYVFTVAGDPLMAEIADQFDYALLSGVERIADPLFHAKDPAGTDVNLAARDLLQGVLQRQLALLAQREVRLHLEISGTDRISVVESIRDMIRGSVKSAGINQEELEQVTGSSAFEGSPFYLRPRPEQSGPPETFVQRYERALTLAAALELDELYVHGTDADLILVRGVPRGAIWQELTAVLLGKGAVVLALLERSVPDWEALAAGLQIVLKLDGFLALLSLAMYLAEQAFPTRPDKQAELLRDIAWSGYWYNRNPEGYSVIVVPVMWPELPEDLATAGAGDAVSAVLAFLGRK